MAIFGLGAPAISSKTLDAHVADAAAAIESSLAETSKGGATPLNLGVATTLSGLWIKDGRSSEYETNLISTEHLSGVVADYHERGFAPIDLVGSTRIFEPWTVVFGPRPSGYYWLPGATADAFRAQDLSLYHAGFRILSLNVRHGRFNATWVAEPLPVQWARWDMSFFELLAWSRHYESEGLRISAVDRYGDGNLYAAVWQPGTGEQIIEAPGGLNVFFGQPQHFLAHKHQDRGLHIHALGHSGYAVAVYRPAFGPYVQGWTASSPAGFRSTDNYYKSQGFRLHFMTHANWLVY